MAAAAKSNIRQGVRRLTDAETKLAMEKTIAAWKKNREEQTATPETAQTEPGEAGVPIHVGETII